jgi:hemerythrin-like domain-containing protein
MDELVEEHVQARRKVGKLVEAKDLYLKSSNRSLTTIIDCLRDLTTFYPKHIIKEDKHFFFPCLDYFSQDEQEGMLQEFREFDRQMIHEKYTKLVEDLLGQR